VRHRNPWAQAAMAALAVSLGASLAVPPVWAADGAPRAGRTTPASAAAPATPGANGPEAVRAAQAPTAAATASATTESKPFFKSTKGVAAVVLMAGMMAYTIHSRTCCAVHSPGR